MSRLRVLVSGASGLVGTALCKALRVPSALNKFHPEVVRLVRRPPTAADELFWDPYEMRIDLKGLEGFDAVVHLAGENVGSGDGLLAFTGRWSDAKKHRILESRRRGTLLLAQALASVRAKPRVLVSASGVGFYGSAADRVLTEASAKGTGFLAEVADVWEKSTAPASAAGIRCVQLRFGVVLARSEGMLAKLYWPFYFGGGGPVGSGEQYLSWIALTDAVRAIEHAIHRPSLVGPCNACAPNPVPNRAFVQALGRAMHRPALLPLPEAVVRTIFGEMGEETLLASQRAMPELLASTGFRFEYPTIDGALAATLAA